MSAIGSNIRYTGIFVENSNWVGGQVPNQIRFLANSHVFQIWGTGVNSNLPLNTINSNIYHTNVMNITSNTVAISASVGIGTTLPQSGLHVAGNVQYDGILGSELLQYAPYLPMNYTNSNTFLSWMQYVTSDRYRNNFAPVSSLMTQSFWGSNVMPFVRKYDSYTVSTITTTIPATNYAYYGGVLVPDGRVVMVPYGYTSIGIFNPLLNTFTTLGNITTGTYECGLLMADGRVLFVPCSGTTIGIFNPTTDTYTTITTTPSPPGNAAYDGGVLLPDGRVVFVPYNYTSIGIFNPSTNTYSTVATTLTANAAAYEGGVLLPDGRVLFIPYYATTIGIFNPFTNTYSTIPYITSSTVTSSGGVVLPDGRVLIVPSSCSAMGLFNPQTNTYTTIIATGYRGGVLLPDGRAMLVPTNTTNIGIFNYRTNTFTTIPVSFGGSYVGGTLLPDGRVILMPYTATNVVILTPTQRVRRPPPELCYHPCFNKY